MKKIKVAYISGPISGLLNGNADNFQKAQTQLEKSGYVVLNPHEIGKELYEKWSKIPRPEDKISAQNYDNAMWAEFMKLDIKYLVTVDCVFVLDNWETSRGTRLELLIAQKLRIPIYYMRNMDHFNVSLEISKNETIPL